MSRHLGMSRHRSEGRTLRSKGMTLPIWRSVIRTGICLSEKRVRWVYLALVTGSPM